ncbi:hypothetical protein [Robbsia andropogonis]|uniref:hypothetical protein n=1 Tax=Robbsia andropogonis TaxID=28092 RepID=UPI000697DACF|nr:hypothetical protein [Robbsia andropogonis]
MPNTASPGINPYLASLTPDQQQSYADLQQKQMIGQALLGQGLTPLDTSNRMAGNTVYRVSPVEGLAKLAQAYVGAKLSREGAAGQNALMAQALSGAFGSDGSGAPAVSSGPAVSGDANMGAMSGVSAGMGGAAPQPSQQALGQALMQNGAAPAQTTTPGPLTLPGQTAARSRQLYMLAPQAYQQALAAGLSPTDATKMATAAGLDTRAANAAALNKSTYIAPVSTRPGGGYVTADGAYHATPSSPPQGYINVADPTNAAGFRTVAVPGGLEAETASTAAKSAGSAQYALTQRYNPQTQQMEYVPVADVANGTRSGAAPTYNPGSPIQPPLPRGGQVPSGGVPPLPPGMDSGLPASGAQGYPAIGGPGGLQPAGGAGAQGYPAIPAMPNGAARPAPQSNQGFPSTSTFAATPPLGATSGANTAGKGVAEAANESYAALQKTRAGGASALQDINHMIDLGAGKSPLAAGPLANTVLPIFSANAKEYEKSRANLVTQLSGQLGLSTDASRELVNNSIPDYGAPKAAIQSGLVNLRNQVQLRQLKADSLTPIFNSGNPQQYNAFENAFDNHVTPALAGVIAMPAGPDRAAALRKAASDPTQRANLEWAAQNGVLK